MSERPLNIVYVADIAQFGGASECLYDLVRSMKEDYGAECSVLFPTKGPLKDRLDRLGVSTFVTGHRGFLVSRPHAGWKVPVKYAIEYALYHSNRNAAVRRAERKIDFTKVDIIHSNLPRNDLGIMLAKRHGIPHVCHLREFSFEDFRCWSYQRKPEQYLSDNSTAFIAVSRACGEAWIRRGVDPSKVRVIYDGIDLSRFRHRGRGTQLHGDGSVLRAVFLGGCNEAKGVMDAVEAFGLLSPDVKKKMSLDIYGWGPHGYERVVLRRINELGLADSVRILGSCDDVPKVLPGYDIGLICSRSEAFGRVVIEYQAAGLAVVGSDVGSIPELLSNGQNGVIYQKELGPESLANELEALATNQSLLLQLQEQGPSYAEKFGTLANARTCRDLYASVLKMSDSRE